MKYVVAALYKFVALPDYKAMKPGLLDACVKHDVKGSLLLASEGINGTIAGPPAGVEAVLAYLKADERLTDLSHKESYATSPPFIRAKVNIKREIVTMGVPTVDPTTRVGTYVKPADWNALISDPDVILVDTRNDYEYGIGTFKGAVDPNTTNFREFPQWTRDNADLLRGKPKVAMFCTGGIRCEKASSFLLDEGYAEVYHLQGGILKYLEEVPEEQSLWSGDCFVFDQRVSVRHGLVEGEYDMCHGCRNPIDADDKASDQYVFGVSCPRCHGETSDQQKRNFAERQKQIALARARDQEHLGVDPRAPSKDE
jgi:UPF0176 protein